MKIKNKKGRYYEKLQNNDETTSEKILKAARKVFAAHTFNSATTRMIADKAGVDHPLIHYYFGSKENLFETVSAQIFEEFNRANFEWFEGIDRIPLSEGFSLYLDRLLDYTLEHPEPFQIMALNMVQAGTINVPGYGYILKNIEWNLNLMEEMYPLLKSRPETKKYLHSFVILVISLLGGRYMHCKMLGMDPEGAEYRKWVKETIYLLFLPWLERLFSSGSKRENT